LEIVDGAASSISRSGLGTTTPERLFGRADEGDVESDDSTASKPYERGSPEYELIKDVASWDRSLAQLLSSKNIDPTDPVVDSVAEKDTILRKVKPIASLRQKFVKRRPNGSLVRRSRKSSGYFSGVPAIYDFSDGNPRRLIRIVESLCAEANSSRDWDGKPISQAAQAKVIRSISQLFRDYLQTIPGARVTLADGRSTVDLYQLLREIGRYFSSGLLLGSFPLDPVSSFTIDTETETAILKLLRIASYHGAIINLDDDERGCGDLRGRRFRLCFTLSPLLQLPLRLYAPVSLSACLNNRHRFVKEASPTNLPGMKQLKLGIE